MRAKTELVLLTGDPAAPTRDVTVTSVGGDRYAVTIDGTSVEVEGFRTDRGIAFRLEGRSFDVAIERRGDTHVAQTTGGRRQVELADARTYRLKVALGGGAGVLKPELRSPMTGKVVLVKATAGDTVAEGQTLVIIEAMKMENELKAVAAATIRSVRVAAGQLVAPGDVLLEFDV